MLRIAICDDVYNARAELRAALERALERRFPPTYGEHPSPIFEFSSGETLLDWMNKHTGELDLIFLDMEMGKLDGMETARRLRAMDRGLQLVFVTGFPEHVFDGYAVGALGYLLKPPKPGQLDDILSRCCEAIYRELDRAFVCRKGEITYRIPLSDILYFVSDRRQVSCVTSKRRYTFYDKLDRVAQKAGQDFVRIHQRYLVRAGAVEQFSGEQITLITGEILPVSRSCRQTALLALTRASLED